MAGRIAFQGELGAYSHQACQQSRPEFEVVPSTTFEEVVDKVARGEVDLGMLAVENSTYGRSRCAFAVAEIRAAYRG